MIKKAILWTLGILLLLLIAGIIAGVRAQRVPAVFTSLRQLSYKRTPCPGPFIFQLPVEMDKVTSMLYPGQERGGHYKPHGGFRFDGSSNHEITVVAPYDAKITAGSRYIEMGVTQYMFDFTHPCGVSYRLDHLLTLSPKLQKLADSLPEPAENDSRTSPVVPSVSVNRGEVLATGVGMTTDRVNTFVDWGVYDYRQPNAISKDPVWAQSHPYELERHGVCWFDWLSPEDEAKIRALSAGSNPGDDDSDYCK